MKDQAKYLLKNPQLITDDQDKVYEMIKLFKKSDYDHEKRIYYAILIAAVLAFLYSKVSLPGLYG